MQYNEKEAGLGSFLAKPIVRYGATAAGSGLLSAGLAASYYKDRAVPENESSSILPSNPWTNVAIGSTLAALVAASLIATRNKGVRS